MKSTTKIFDADICRNFVLCWPIPISSSDIAEASSWMWSSLDMLGWHWQVFAANIGYVASGCMWVSQCLHFSKMFQVMPSLGDWEVKQKFFKSDIHPLDSAVPRCPGCLQITTVFSHAQTVVLCGRLVLNHQWIWWTVGISICLKSWKWDPL